MKDSPDISKSPEDSYSKRELFRKAIQPAIKGVQAAQTSNEQAPILPETKKIPGPAMKRYAERQEISRKTFVKRLTLAGFLLYGGLNRQNWS